MSNRFLRVLVLTVCLLALIAAPATFAQDENVLLYGGNQDIDNIDPATGENYSINAALVSLYDALFIVRGEELQPNLVDTWEVNDDATVWTFNLKPNAVFHDGSPVNADAVVYSFNRIMTLQGPPTYRWAGIADADSAVALDEDTVQFTLLQPFAPFLGTLSQLYIVNPAIVEANRGDDFGQTFLRTNAAGSGPFTMGRWEIGNVYEFIAVQDYWGGWSSENHPDRALWIIRRDSASQVNSLLANETHIADTIDLNDAARISETDGYYIENNGGLFTNSLKMNTQGEYMSDINLRKAVAYAMNYEALPQVLDVPVQLMFGPTPSNFPGALEGLDVPTYDLEKAREYLAMTPWPEGGIALDYVYVSGLTFEEVTGLVLLEGLAELGITLNMTPMLWPDMVAACSDPASGPDIINIFTQPAYLDMDAHLYNQYHSTQWGSYNSCSFYANERVDELLDTARVTGDPAARAELYNEAQALIAADQPSVWTFTQNSVLAFNECVQGYDFRPLESLSVLFQDLELNNCPV